MQIELGLFQATCVHRVAPAKPREIPQLRAIPGNKKTALRAGSCWCIGGGVCRNYQPFSFIIKEIRACPCSTAEIRDEITSFLHERKSVADTSSFR